jgi:hypothetical protein
MASERFEYNFPLGQNWKAMTPANFVKQKMKNKVIGRLPFSRRRALNIANKRQKHADEMKRNYEIRLAQEAAAVAPKTAANIAFEARLARRAEELSAMQNEIRRQRHISGAEAARDMLNLEGEEDFVNGEINSRNSLNPVITDLQSQIYALEHANPVNSAQLEKVRAMLEVAEAQQMVQRIEDELPRIISLYGEDSAMAADMYDTQQEALERAVDAVARLEALQAARGGRRRTRKQKRRN